MFEFEDASAFAASFQEISQVQEKKLVFLGVAQAPFMEPISLIA